MAVTVVMVDPQGREWLAGSPEEVVNLQARGYRFKGAGAQTQPAPTQPERAPAEQPTEQPTEQHAAPAGEEGTK